MWIALGTALIAAAAALAGVWLSHRGALEQARQALEGQRQLARDESMRDWRRNLVTPYLEGARHRVRIWAELAGNPPSKMMDRTEWLSLTSQLIDADFGRMMITVVEVPDAAFVMAFSDFVRIEGSLSTDLTREQILEVSRNMVPVMGDLTRSAEHYIFNSSH